jgi:hypothetical protein
MKRMLALCISFSVLISVSTETFTGAGLIKRKRKDVQRFKVEPKPSRLPAELSARYPSRGFLRALPDTFPLGSWGFDDGTASGWRVVDLTSQTDTFFHVADGTELDGGGYGNLLPLEGSQSMWCGVASTSSPPYCNWSTLPGYGSGWDQRFESTVLYGDSIKFSCKIRWDIEWDYDRLYIQYYDYSSEAWVDLQDKYATGTAVESFSFNPPQDSTRLRFWFVSDGGWDDEDGLWNTDGAVLIDSITVAVRDTTNAVELDIIGSVNGWTGTGRKFDIAGDYAFVAKGTDGVQAIDISVPTSPVLSGTYNTPGIAHDVAVDGSYAYVADDNSLQILDISTPSSPTYEGSVALFYGGGSDGRGVDISGTVALVAHEYGLELFDVSDPSSPLSTGFISINGSARGVTVEGNYAYVVGGTNGLDIVNITNPSNPILTGSLPIWVGTSYHVTLAGTYAYVASGLDGLVVVDIADPANPGIAGALNTGGESYSVDVAGDSAYVADGSGGLLVVGISNPLSPQEADTCTTPSAAVDVMIEGDYIYVLAESDGLQTIGSGNWTVMYENFEYETPGSYTTGDGIWSADVPEPFGIYAGLHDGISVLQEDPCKENSTYLWGFFDDPLSTNYSCGEHPEQGAMPYGPNVSGYWLDNMIVSPVIDLTGSSGSFFELRFSVYRDLPMDNLQFYYWKVRSWTGGCPGYWRDDDFFYYGAEKDWFVFIKEIGAWIDPSADSIEVAIGTVDMYQYWEIMYGTGSCHSHAPLIDDISLTRIDNDKPVFAVEHIHLFQDNFPSDGTTTGTARADMAADRRPYYSAEYTPGDSVVVTVSSCLGLDTDPYTGSGPAVYAHVAVFPRGQPGKSGSDIQSAETRSEFLRWPFVASETDGNGNTWYVFRMDTVFTEGPGGTIPADNRYCFDLNDDVFTPGDSICYYFSAENTVGDESFCSRDLNGQGATFTSLNKEDAQGSSMEFCILPRPGKVILYVDDADDRGGPVQAYFDAAFGNIGVTDSVDRYDVLGPSSCAGNGPGSRVADVINQLVQYKAIIWSSGNLGWGLIGNGPGSPDKSDDFEMLYSYLDQHGQRAGLYISGDNNAEEWSTLGTGYADGLRSEYMNFNLEDGDHQYLGEPMSPRLLRVGGGIFDSYSSSDSLIAYGGCPDINDFDILQETGLSSVEMKNRYTGRGYILSQETSNDMGEDVGVVLSGFSFHYIRDGFAEFSELAQAKHLHDILEWLMEEDFGDPDYYCDIAGIDSTPVNSRDVALHGGYACVVCDADPGLYMIDVHLPSSTNPVGNCDTPGDAQRVMVSGDYAYVADGFKILTVTDISYPSNPTVVFNYCDKYEWPVGGFASDLDIKGNYVYIAADGLGLMIINITNPLDPDSVGVCDTWQAKGVAISGDYAYVADLYAGMKVIDISNPANPFIAASNDPGGSFKCVAVTDSFSYFGGEVGGIGRITVFEIFEPSSPALIRTIDIDSECRDIVLNDGLAYVASREGFEVLDISDPGSPEILSSCRAFEGNYGWDTNYGIDADANYAYVANYSKGLLILEPYLGSTTDSDPTTPRFSNFLDQNYPNPFNPSTTIRFGLKEESPVMLKIFDVSGRLVRTMVNETRPPGDYTAVWDGRNEGGRTVSSGVYFYILKTKNYRRTKKLVLLR